MADREALSPPQLEEVVPQEVKPIRDANRAGRGEDDFMWRDKRPVRSGRQAHADDARL